MTAPDGAAPVTAPEGAAPPPHADVALLAERLGDRVLDHAAGQDGPTVLVAREAVADAARLLRDEGGYQLLRSVTAVDFLPAEPRFQVVYHLVAIPAHVVGGDAEVRTGAPARFLRLKAPVPADDPVVPSVVGVYPTANFHEREVWDLFGIEFAGHPDLARILMPENWSGHPLRKDYPLTYEEVAFTFNAAKVARDKPRATE